jgi:CRISPR-associated endoribonuclease Cas6
VTLQLEPTKSIRPRNQSYGDLMMFRIRVRSPKGRSITYTNADVLKDAAFNMLRAAGCPAELLIGKQARHWGAGAVCPRKIASGAPVRRTSEILVSTIDPGVAAYLVKADPGEMRKHQPATGENIDMSGAVIVQDLDPVTPGSSFIDAIALSPIVVSRRDRTEQASAGRFYGDASTCDLSAAVNLRLSRIVGRQVALNVVPDDFYLSERPDSHAVRTDIKNINGKPGVVVGLVFPFVLCGSPDDLRLAWYAGLGEKNRLGFGFFGMAA